MVMAMVRIQATGEFCEAPSIHHYVKQHFARSADAPTKSLDAL